MAKDPNLRRALMLGSVAMRSLSTATMLNAEPTTRIAFSPSYSSASPSLYSRLSVLAPNRDGTVANVLDGWVMEGNSVNKKHILTLIKELRKYKRFRRALELIDWMEMRGINLSHSDYAMRIDLLSKTKGIEAAEQYFTSLSEFSNNQLSYGALFCCYCTEKMKEKAMTLFEKMKELNFFSTTFVYNKLISLYIKLDQPEKVPPLVEEMKAANILPDKFTYNLLMGSYASLRDIEAVEKVMEEIKANGFACCDWTTYCNLARIYVASGHFNKANLALKQCEKIINVRDRMAYHFLITLHAGTSNLAAVKRVWKSLKSAFPKTTNSSYLTMLQSLARLDDLDGMKKCYEEWESGCSSYDIRLANVLINYYRRQGMNKEAETLIENAMNKVSELTFRTLEKSIDFYLNQGEMKLALKYTEGAVNKVKKNEWHPNQEKVGAFLKYFEDQKDIDGAEEFCKMLKKVCRLNSEDYNALLRTYIAAEKTEPCMRQRVEEDEIEMSPETEDLLEKVCPIGIC